MLFSSAHPHVFSCPSQVTRVSYPTSLPSFRLLSSPCFMTVISQQAILLSSVEPCSVQFLLTLRIVMSLACSKRFSGAPNCLQDYIQIPNHVKVFDPRVPVFPVRPLPGPSLTPLPSLESNKTSCGIAIFIPQGLFTFMWKSFCPCLPGQLPSSKNRANVISFVYTFPGEVRLRLLGSWAPAHSVAMADGRVAFS